jgi:Diels-Alderase, C-terminal domain
VGAFNSTSYELWLFDAVTQDGQSSIAVVFFRMVDPSSPSLDYVEVTIAYPNGTIFDQSFPANFSSVTTDGFGASGVWDGVGSFSGSPDLSVYSFSINTSTVQGTYTVESSARAHYADGSPPGSNATVFLAPLLGWMNAIPAGVASVDFEIMGEPFAFTKMVGYHDHNFGGLALSQADKSWYFGHATVGPYSLVWFDILSNITGTRSSSVYLVKDGDILLANNNTPFESAEDFVLVLPFGNGTQYPPPTSRMPLGFVVHFVGKGGEQWSFIAEGSIVLDTSQGTPAGYTRWAGTVTGGEVGGISGTGSGVWEWLRFFDSEPGDSVS